MAKDEMMVTPPTRRELISSARRGSEKRQSTPLSERRRSIISPGKVNTRTPVLKFELQKSPNSHRRSTRSPIKLESEISLIRRAHSGETKAQGLSSNLKIAENLVQLMQPKIRRSLTRSLDTESESPSQKLEVTTKLVSQLRKAI